VHLLQEVAMSLVRYVRIFAICSLFAACTPPLSSAPTQLQTRHILFVGNSYTYQHNVPEKVVTYLNQGQPDRVRYQAAMVADGGRNLIQYVDDARVLDHLSRADFEFIVLQDRSTATFYSTEYQHFFQAVSWFAQQAQAEGAQLVLYQTWPRRAGHEFYNARANPSFSPPPNPAEMQLKLAQTYQTAATHH
jgi:hypothetical protein